MTNKKKVNHPIKKIVLAAGRSNRFGEKNKLSEIINGKPIINNILDTLLKTFASSELIVIVGHEYKEITNLINNEDVKILKNIKYKKGIGTSISLAIKNLERNIQGVMIIPADMPYITSMDLINLEKTFLEYNCEKVIMPQHNLQTGNPLVLPKIYFNILKSLNDDFGAKSLIKKKDIVNCKTGVGTIIDIDTRDDLTVEKSKF